MGNFQLARSTTINASAADIHALINDFRGWVRWSPWEGLDPDLQRTYTGPDAGVGSHYHWAGNKKAGEGTMQITSSTPQQVVVDLAFLKPFKAENVVTFDLTETVAASTPTTQVTWTMTGQRGLVMRVLGSLFFDKSIAGDFDKGLAQLKAAAEAR